MKRNIPLVAKRFIDKLYNDNIDFIEKQLGDGYYVRFNDRNINSEFFFTINKAGITGSKFQYNISYFPDNEFGVNVRTSVIQEEENVLILFKKWLDWISEYNSDSPVFDDLITQSYFDELEPKFILIDDDKFTRPFSISQQKIFCLVLDKITQVIENENLEEEKKDEIIAIANNIKVDLSNSNKAKIINSLRKLVAKCYKIGLNIGESVIVEISKTAILGQLGI